VTSTSWRSPPSLFPTAIVTSNIPIVSPSGVVPPL
jgi:hypothetical protein